jgi:hypothetical protein
MRQKEANLTALAAIGPRKKRKTEALEGIQVRTILTRNIATLTIHTAKGHVIYCHHFASIDFYISIFILEITLPNETKLNVNIHWMVFHKSTNFRFLIPIRN